MNFIGYQCSKCGVQYGAADITYTCPEDGSNLDVRLDYAAIRASASVDSISSQREPSIWRYLPLLPVGDPGNQGTQLRAVGWTPLIRSGRLAEGLKLKAMWFKDDGRNPTASFKDRASAVVVARAVEIGAKTIITASTGNAGAALAGMAAAAGVPAVILAPSTAPEAKVAQLLIYGAQVILVDGNYDQAFDLSLEAAQEFDWYCRNTGYNPFTTEGKKTAAFEIVDDLGDAPDYLFIPVGNAGNITAYWRGFREYQQAGRATQLPRMMGFQAAGAAPIVSGSPVANPQTIASAIRIGNPAGWQGALEARDDSGGVIDMVSDDEILEAYRLLASHEGIFCEPASAAAFAGLVKMRQGGLDLSGQRIVCIATGNGLKDPDLAVSSVVAKTTEIEPTIEAVEAVALAMIR